MNRKLIIFLVVIASIALSVGVVKAASEHNVTATLGGAAGDYFDLDGVMKVNSLVVGQQSIGGVTFFNGTIVNSTTNAAGADNPVTFGDNVRVDGRVYRGTTAGTADAMPFIVNDNMELAGNLAVTGDLTVADGQTLTVGDGSALDVAGTTITGLSVADLSDGSTVAKADVSATLTADWVNTAYPWAADEIADTTRTTSIPLSGLYTDANGTPAAITAGTVPALAYSANQGLFLQYAEDDTVDFGGQIVVPADYASGGVLKAVVDTSGNLVTDWNLDWQVAISETANTAAWATSMANETPVDVPDNAGTPDVITFTPTSQSDISAGDVLYLDVWPDSNTAAGEPNVEIYSMWFEYTAIQ
ncbi:MAG: hypothetical protein WCV50_06700 [Patescibacteria group bacterium]|jgi:hypothetical protein